MSTKIDKVHKIRIQLNPKHGQPVASWGKTAF